MEITNEEFIRAMREAVAQRGKDWVYPKGQKGWVVQSSYTDDDSCVYVRTDEDSCGCLIGQALHLAGVELQWLRAREGLSAYAVLRDLHLSEGVAAAAWDAQIDQDMGKAWGEVLATFEAELPTEEAMA